MVPYSKPAKPPADLVQQLKQRGLAIADEARAERYIDNIGYYRLSAYMYPFLAEPKTAHQYKPGITFDRVLRLYRFDKKLRVLLFNEIEKIEVAFRAAVVNTITDRTGDIFWMTNPSYVNAGTLALIQREYAHSTEDFILHFKNAYSNPYPPAWILSEILPFGNITWIFRNLSPAHKKAVSKKFFLHAPVLESWMNVVTLTRNSCCHHARVWNKVNSIIPNNMAGMTRPWIDPATDKRRTYYNICIRKQRRHSKSQTRKMTRRLLELLGKILKEIRKTERAYENAQSLLTSREKGDLEIITRMYRQQKNHFQSKDCRESIPNRIVSISKPYVRPIVRSKEVKSIEKLFFNAFNEGTRLIHCLKMHKRLFGVEAKKVGGDTGYAGTDNRDYCKENGIQTSFVKRGRPFSEEKNEKDLVRKELARVRATAMEGSFGTQKEHYDLRRVKARTKLTEILYIFFGIHTANVVQLEKRIEQRALLEAA